MFEQLLSVFNLSCHLNLVLFLYVKLGNLFAFLLNLILLDVFVYQSVQDFLFILNSFLSLLRSLDLQILNMLSLVLLDFPGSLTSFHFLILFNDGFGSVNSYQCISLSIFLFSQELIRYHLSSLVLLGSSLIGLMNWSVVNSRHDVVFFLSCNLKRVLELLLANTIFFSNGL